ncbi:MAG: adenosylcobinamide-phosphate synthase CbiB [Thermodesulfobacteriota bacterium]
MSAYQFVLAYLLDLALGDPKYFPHPVRGIGYLIRVFEKVLRWPSSRPAWEKAAGCLLAIGLPAGIFAGTFWLIEGAKAIHPWVGSLLVIVLAYTTLATRSLHLEAARVVKALKEGRVLEARRNLSRIVGRDTEHLTYPEILKAVLETLAENLSDGIIAPLFYLLLGGVPLAMAFKTVSTLDSMVGYKDNRYLHFGWASARLDDLFNYIPARITGLLICLLAWLLGLSFEEAWRIRKRDGQKSESPNAAIPEAALAGALQIQLGGPAIYDGEKCDKPYLGDDRSEITMADYKKTVMIIYGSSLVMAVIVFGLRLLWDWETN